MAFTSTVQFKTVYGNQRIHSFMVTADAATGTVVTGFESVFGIVGIAPYSMATSAVKLKSNTLTSGTAAAGTIAISGCTSGDQFEIVVAGK
jgi:hypothetical protein